MDDLQAGDPREVGPYCLEARLGGGGMGRVFLGRSLSGRPVAVKLVRPELAGDTQFRHRFTDEVRAARLVGGFFTAPVLDADTDADAPWLVTAYIPGPSLRHAVEKHGPLPATAIGVLGAGLAEGLTAIHAHVVHRDLKPSNVILASDGPRVIDFGIARAFEATSHTSPGTVIGTPGFMSPEQARGGDVDTPSDVFSLGAVLAFAATGHSPFGTGRVEAVIYRVIHDEPDLAGLPADLVDLVAACLAKDPDRRPSVADLLDRLADPSRTYTQWLPPHVLGSTSSAESGTAATVREHRRVRIKTLHDKCFDLKGGLPSNHTPITQYDCHGGPNQIFTLVPTGDGRHQIRTMHDKCLEVPFSWVDNNVTIVQCHNYNGENQKFWIRDVGEGKVEIRTLHYKALTVRYGVSDNISIVQYDWFGKANQQFRIEDI